MNLVAIFPLFVLALSIILNLLSFAEKRKVICAIFFVGSALLIGLRSVHTAGTDTFYVYEPIFNQLQDQSIVDVISHYLLRDPLFYLFTKLFTLISLDFHVYIFLIALFVSGSISYFIYKYSSYPILSFALFMLFQYFGFEFQMLKHSIAFSILLFSYPYLLDRKPRYFVGIVVLAGLFHISALVFLISYFVSKIKPHAFHLVFFIFFSVAILVFRDEILALLEIMFQGDRFQMYFSASYDGRLPLTGFFIAITVFLLALFVTPKKYWSDKVFVVLFNLSYLSCLILLGVVIFGESVRVSMLFGMGSLLLLPFAIEKSSLAFKYQAIGLISFICILHFIFFGIENAGLSNYVFFWQE